MSYINIEARANALMIKRGIVGHTATARFLSDFKAYLVYFDATGLGSAADTLSLLEDDTNLTNNSILHTNFRCKLSDLVSEALYRDPIFPELFKVLLGNKGKGVGQGEMALPLIISDYQFSNKSDGRFTHNGISYKSEVKDGGASLKPVERGIPGQYDGLVDVLNKKYWNGTVPGKRRKDLFETHRRTVNDPKEYANYFKELYLGCNTTDLANEVLTTYTDPDAFNTSIGKFALKEYQKVDQWNNIIFIDAGDEDGSKKERERAANPEVVNIADVNNISNLNLKFSPVLSRAKDTQAISDGYVNVGI
jgi:hypothetical protein